MTASTPFTATITAAAATSGRSTSITTVRRSLLAVAALLALGAGAPKGRDPGFDTLRPVPVELPAGVHWSEPVFAAADRQGVVSFLDSKAMTPYPLRVDGKLGEPEKWRLASTAQFLPLRATLSRNGDWLLFEPPFVRLFRGDKEDPLPKTDWSPFGVGFLRDYPLVSVRPWRIVPGKPHSAPSSPPLVLRWNGKAWETLISEPLPAGLKDPFAPTVTQLRMVHLLGDSSGRLWVANERVYRLRRFSAAGKLQMEVTLGPQELLPRDDAGRVQARLQAEAKTWSAPPGGTIQASSASAKTKIAALAEGRDGKIYLLAGQPWEGGAYALDRFDPVTVALQRTLVRLPELSWVSAAAGKDALYLVAADPAKGMWKLSWEDIDAARWKPIREAEVDGVCGAAGE
jgi:hypothetical protein